MCSPYSKPHLSAEWRSRLDAEFAGALARGVFSGASLLVSQNRELLLERTWGTVQTGGAPITPASRFDLASLTKPLVTAPLCMTAFDKGLFDMEDPIARFFPGRVPADKNGITVRSLLSHSSGLPAWAPLYLELVKLPSSERKEALASMILATPLDTPPGITANYSDLGFMLLGLILERLLGASLDSLARDLLFSPLGIEELHFCPLEPGAAPLRPPAKLAGNPASTPATTPPAAILQAGNPAAAPVPIPPAAILQAGNPAAAPAANPGAAPAAAATQFCPWRKRLLSGEVDDENAWALDGIAGHAGLFGTARGVFQLLSFLWGLYEGDAHGSSFAPALHPAITARTLRTFWTRSAESDWCLGFDTPSRKGYSSTGRFFTQNAVGHLGFTGVSFWLDLEKRILIILLTNRVHPTRQNDEIRQFRPVLHDLVMKELLNGN